MGLNFAAINPVAFLPSSSRAASSVLGQGNSVAGTLVSQFVQEQGSLIFSRFSTRDRAFIQQGIQDRAQTLERAARSLFSRNSGMSVFDSREVVAVDSTAVTGTAKRLTSPFTFGVEVEQLAQAQKVVSDNLSDAGDNFVDGTEAFSLTAQGTTFAFSIGVVSSDTNLDVLQKIAAAFNAASSSGVHAEIASDTTTGNSSLQLTAPSTGTDSAFSLSGSILSGINLEETIAVNLTAGTGGLVSSAQDAIFNLDAGPSLTSQTNTVSVHNGSVELVFSATTNGKAVTVRVEPDASKIEKDLQTFVTAFNDALSFAQALPSEATHDFARELTASVAPLAVDLEAIGIGHSGNGELFIASAPLAAAITDGRFARASASFIGAAGLATSAERASRNLLDAGGKFLTQPNNRVERSALLAISRAQNLGLIVNLIA